MDSLKRCSAPGEHKPLCSCPSWLVTGAGAQGPCPHTKDFANQPEYASGRDSWHRHFSWRDGICSFISQKDGELGLKHSNIQRVRRQLFLWKCGCPALSGCSGPDLLSWWLSLGLFCQGSLVVLLTGCWRRVEAFFHGTWFIWGMPAEA